MEVMIHSPNIFFTADDHFDHWSPCPVTADLNRRRQWKLCPECERWHEPKGSILTLGKGRPFKTIDEHNEALIDNHNSVVKPGDLVYNLGDFALKTTQKRAQEFRRRMAGNIYFILGNHDSIAKSIPGSWVWMKELERIHPKIDGIPPITLCHYAMRTWSGSHRGSWMLYGHSHGMLPEMDTLLSFDVGVDCWNFTPVSIEQVAARMKTKLPAWEAYHASLRDTGRAE
jgi:calcineurin-like phosphoesterase family protein